MKRRGRKIVGYLLITIAVGILLGASCVWAYDFEVVTTPPSQYYHQNTVNKPPAADGKYVYNVQVNIKASEWGENKRYNKEYIDTFFNKVNKVYDDNGIKIRYNINQVYLYTDSSQEFKWTGANNNVIVNLDNQYGRSWYSSAGYTRIYDYSSSMDTAMYTTCHELGHFRGNHDLYANNVKINKVNGELRQSSYQGIMNNQYINQTFNPYHKYVLNKLAGQTKTSITQMMYAIPAENYFQVLDKNGNPIPNAQVTLYNGVADCWKLSGCEVDSTPDLQATTNSQGRFEIPRDVIAERWISNNTGKKVQLIQIKANGQTKYVWRELEDYNVAYWLGEKETLTWKYDFDNGKIIDIRQEKLAQANSDFSQANSLFNSGKYEEAKSYYEKAMTTYQALKDTGGGYEEIDYSARIRECNLKIMEAAEKEMLAKKAIYEEAQKQLGLLFGCRSAKVDLDKKKKEYEEALADYERAKKEYEEFSSQLPAGEVTAPIAGIESGEPEITTAIQAPQKPSLWNRIVNTYRRMRGLPQRETEKKAAGKEKGIGHIRFWEKVK